MGVGQDGDPGNACQWCFDKSLDSVGSTERDFSNIFVCFCPEKFPI